jgi:hypothetical protein
MAKLLAPNGKPSNLSPEQYELVRLPEFKAWFGDWENLILTKINDSGIDEISLKRLEDGVSKVVDENGEPLPVYHGSKNIFNQFDKIKIGFNTDNALRGFYFTDNSSVAYSYTYDEMEDEYSGNVIEVFLYANKIKIIDAENKNWLEFSETSYIDTQIKKEFENGYDCIIVKNISDPFIDMENGTDYYGNNFVVDNPNQIKLADGTNTTFDAGNPDIRFEDGGAINKSNDFIGTWEELKKYNPNLWETGILRRSQNPQGATDIIPKDVFIRQFQWQNYGQYDEIEAETIYGEPDNYGYYNDTDGNPITDERTGNYLKDEFDYENNAERIKATISNKQLKNNLIDSFQTQEGKEYLKKVIATLPKNEDGTITAYRIGTIGEDLQSYTLSEGMAKTFSNQGTDIMPSGLPSIPNEGYKDYGVLPVNKVKINPKGIVAWSPYDSEILVELKYIKTDNSKNSYADGGGVTDSYKIEFIDDRVLINRNDFGLLEFSIKENELEIRRLYLNKENQRVGIGRKIIGELFNQNPDVNKIIVYPLGSSIPFWLRFTEKVREDDYFEITKDSLKKGNENYPLKNNNRNDKFNDGGETQINEEAQQYIDIISMNPKLDKYQKYKVILKDKFGIDFDSIYKDQEYIDNANLNDIKKQDDFLDFDNWLNYAKIISKKRGFIPMDSYLTPSDKYKLTDEIWNETSKNLDFIIKKIPYTERGTGSGDIARAFGDTIYYTDYADFYYFLHELGHIYNFQNNIEGIIKNPAYSPTNYGTTNGGETFAENFAIYFINPMALKNWNEDVYNAMDSEINEKYKNEINRIMPKNKDITFENGGDVIINPTEIECHTCHWKWKVKDGGDDLFICHKCYTDNTKYYKFEGLEGEKILDTISYAKGGRTIAQAPAPKKDQIKGSDKNKEGSSKDLKSAKKIELSDSTIEAIKNKVDKHNEKYPKKKITIDSAKAVVRRGMGAYSTSYRPTISGGKPNSRVAWGLARLNAFLYKIVNGKSKSGKYSQDNDLIEELGYKVQKYSDGGELENEELNKIKEAYDFGSEYFEGEIYGQEYKIRMNKNHPRNSNRNDDQSIHNLSLVNVDYPSAVVFREKYDKMQYQYDKVYDWDIAKEKIEDFFYEIKERSDDYSEGGEINKNMRNEIIDILSKNARYGTKIFDLQEVGLEVIQSCIKSYTYFGNAIRQANENYIMIPINYEDKLFAIDKKVEYIYFSKPNETTKIRIEYKYDMQDYPVPVLFDSELMNNEEYFNINDYEEIKSREFDSEFLYRGINNDEMLSIIDNGFIKSNASMNIGKQQEETTSFAQHISQASSYAVGFNAWFDEVTFAKPKYILKVKKEGVNYKPTIETDIQNEVDVFGEIPIQQIESIYEIKLGECQMGSVEINVGYESNFSEGSRFPMFKKVFVRKTDVSTLINEINSKNKIEKNNDMTNSNPKDTITMDIPLLIRFAELMREDIKTDVDLHRVVENLIQIKDKGILTMDDYESIVGNVTGTEENTNIDAVEEEKMAEGGKVNSIKSKKGDIKISLDENWYSDDTKVELVPVSELMKFREFDRKVKPKYNQENSRDNINHLKFMFEKNGVQEPLIIEYSPQDKAVLVIEGNHRINSAIDLGMEYLPARVVLKKYSKFTPSQLKNSMKVEGIKANSSNYIPSDLKPSQIGITGAMPIYGDGGIIEGRLHSECGDDGCGRKFQVGEDGHIIEAERDEAVIVANAFKSNEELTIKGTLSEVASALNVVGGGKNFDKGATIIKNGSVLEIPELKKQATNTDVDDIIDPSSIIINRRSMADTKKYEVTGTPKQIASAINSINGNGVVIENGAEIKEN